MQQCANCKIQFSTKQVLKSFWFGYNPIKCDACQSTFSHTFRNRLITGACLGIGLFLGNFIMINSEFGLDSRLNDFNYRLLLGFTIMISFTLLLSFIAIKFLKFEKED